MMLENYYVILGVGQMATSGEIKAAYRDRVKELHPDYYGEDQELFLAVQEAYAVLSDPRRRHAYDNQLERFGHRQGAPVNSAKIRVRQAPIEEVFLVKRPAVEEVTLTRSVETYSPFFEEVVTAC